MEREHAFWLYISEALENPSAVRRLYHQGDLRRRVEQAGESPSGQRMLRPSPGVQTASLMGRYDPDRARERYKKLLQCGLFMLTYRDNRYPARLRQLPDPPAVLFGRGDITCLDGPTLAVVGSRRCSAYGRTVSARFARELAAHGVAVVSGLARGVDTWAHRGALDGGGRTVAVLGSGLHRIYPAENTRLADDIAVQGLLLSEYPPQTGPQRLHFPERNRIISGLGDRLLVVEAARKSGSLITAGFSLELGKDVYAVPGNIDSQTSAGTNRLIRDGAFPALHWQDLLA